MNLVLLQQVGQYPTAPSGTTISNSLLMGIIMMLFGGLLGSGALAWFIRSGTDMKIAQLNSSDAKKKTEELGARVSSLEARVTTNEVMQAEIRTGLNEIRAKLSKVDGMEASIEFIREIVGRLQERHE